LSSYRAHRDLPSFPTRRSSDLLAVSLATALSFVGYFTPARQLAADLVTFEIGMTAAFWLFFFTAATYINAGWLREKVCLHMCPRSEEHTSALQSRENLVCRLLP